MQQYIQGGSFNWTPPKVQDPMETGPEFFQVSAVIKGFCTQKILGGDQLKEPDLHSNPGPKYRL